MGNIYDDWLSKLDSAQSSNPETTIYSWAMSVGVDAVRRMRSLQPPDVAGQVLIYGKGSKTRAVKLPATLWQELQSLRSEAAVGERCIH